MPISTKNRRKRCFNFIFCLLLVICLTSCGFSPKNGEKKLSRSELYLDTVVTITLYGETDDSLLDSCFALCRDYELIFSRTDPDSELYRLNEAGSMEVSDELLAVLELALDYCETSGGAFDITMGAVSSLYGFSSEHPTVPSPEALRVAMSHVGYEKLRIDDHTVTLTDPAAVIDLGAIAKGYIADRLAGFLREAGVEGAVIDLGGNIYCLGTKPDGSAFTVGIQCPFEDRSSTIAAVAASDRSVVTSGLYERSFEQDGVLYHHILDPDTGMPSDTGLLGASIVSERSVDGDALSTICFLLGLEKATALIESLDGVSAVFVTEDYALHYAGGFENVLE